MISIHSNTGNSNMIRMGYAVNEEETVFVSFKDEVGRTFLTLKVLLNKNLNEVLLNTSSLLSGTYYVKIYSSQIKSSNMKYTKDISSINLVKYIAINSKKHMMNKGITCN